MLNLITSLLFIFLALFPFGQLAKIPLNFLNMPSINLYLTDIILFLLVISWIIWKVFDKKRKYHLPPLAKPIFLFSVLALISLLVNLSVFGLKESLVGSLYLIRWLFYAGIYFVVFDLRKKLDWLKWHNKPCFLLIIGSAIAIFGLIQYSLWPDFKALETLNWDPHFYRLVGTFFDPGFTGLILALNLFLIIILWLESKNKWFLALGLIVYSSLALTYSRASWLVFLLGAGLILLTKKAFKVLIGIAILIAMTFFLLPRPAGEGGKIERTYTINARLINYEQSLKIAKDNPFFGVGFNNYRYAQRNYGFLSTDEWQTNHAGAGADNSFLLVLATTGIFGFLAYLWLWGRVLKENKKNILVVVSLLAIIGHSLFLNSLFYPWVMVWLWLLLALTKENN